MELEWNQNHLWPTGSITIAEGSCVEYSPTHLAKLRITVGHRGLEGFTFYFRDAVLEQIKRALLSPEELILAETARVRAVERRQAPPTAPPLTAATDEEI